LEQIMSDPIAEAAASLGDAAPSSTEPLPNISDDATALAAANTARAEGFASQAEVDALVAGAVETPQEAGTAAAGESAQSSPASTTSITPEPSSAEVPNDAATPPAGAATPASMGNVLVNAAPVVDAPVIDAPAAEPMPMSAEEHAALPDWVRNAQPPAAPLPRESHLMLLEAKFANALAKLRNAERVSVDELEAIYVHIKAVI
jgi:hypothetical protein